VFKVILKLILVLLIAFGYICPSFAQNTSDLKSLFSPEPEFRGFYQFEKRLVNPSSLDSIKPLNESPDAGNKINYVRLGIVSGASLAILGGIYYRWKTAWWTDPAASFHIQYNYTYTQNVDKIGHLYGGILFAECFGAGLRWAGLDEEPSLLYGAMFSTLVYTGVEIKDGYAPTWGFDPMDLMASAVGAFYPYTQKKIPFLQNFNFKYSYFPSNTPYYNKHKDNQFFNDDYEGETFWLAANMKNLLPTDINSFMPDFLNIAVGVSVENLDNPSARQRVFIISPDIDLVKLFNPENEFLKEALRLLNYIHIPLPALKISPDFKAYPIYLKP
jgi:hypothetical protein